MRMLNIIAVLLTLTSPGYIAAARAEPQAWLPVPGDDPLHGTLPGKSVKSWIMLTLLTPRTIPAPIFLISPATFDVDNLQILIRLTKSEYKSFDAYTRSYNCEQTSGNYLPSQVLEAIEHSKGKTGVVCRMSLPVACQYLNGIGTTLSWTERNWQPLRKVRTRFGCT